MTKQELIDGINRQIEGEIRGRRASKMSEEKIEFEPYITALRSCLYYIRKLDEPKQCKIKIVESKEYPDFDILTCSNCKENIYKRRWRNDYIYCPICGAKIIKKG